MDSLILKHLQNVQSSWSLGAFGALGEFSWDRNETLLISPDEKLTICTSRGGLRIDSLDQCTPIAYETARRHRDHWGQALALCLSEQQATMSGRKTITEVGHDKKSLLDLHRDDILFDLGLGTPYVDIFVRTSSSELIDALRAASGSSILAKGNKAFSAILQHNPHRVFVSRVGRLEVYQAIGVDASPEGPHTHVLPKLLASGLHDAANTPIPSGMVSGLMLYPGNPCVDLLGKPRAFDLQLHQQFEGMLSKYGLPDYVQEKERIINAYNQGIEIDDYSKPNNKLGRLAARISLRQLAHTQPDSEQLKQWRTCFDRPQEKKEVAL